MTEKQKLQIIIITKLLQIITKRIIGQRKTSKNM